MLIINILLFILLTTGSALKVTDESQCNSTLASLFMNISYAIAIQNFSGLVLPPGLVENSGRGINDLGFYETCNKADYSRYMFINVLIGTQQAFIGFCGPSVCVEESYNQLHNIINPLLGYALDQIYNTSGIQVQSNFKDPDLQHPDLDGGAYFVIIIVCFLLLLVVLGTVIEIYNMIGKKVEKDDNLAYQQINEESPIKESKLVKLVVFLKAFSLIANAEKVFSLKPTSDQNLDIFNGVRFLSMCWVILGHTYMLRIKMIYTTNQILDIIEKPGISTIVLSGPYSVDIFFFLGGFFVSFVLVTKFKALKKASFKVFGEIYFHRIYRIWPSYVLCILIFYKVSVYLWIGPAWSFFNSMVNMCDGKWWTNLLYIDNLFGRDTSHYCFGWGWYLSNDFQMFLVSPFVLFLYTRNKKIGLASLWSLLGISFLISFLVSYKNHFKIDTIGENNDNTEFFNLYYSKPWIRCDVYILGLILGIFYLNYKNKDNYLTLKRWLNNTYYLHIVCYAIGILLVNLMIWLIIPIQKVNDSSVWNDTQHIFYLIFHRFTFVFGFVLVILPGLLTGKDVVYEILSFRLFTPLGRLTYCTYLVHLIVLARTSFGTNQSFYASNEAFIYVALTDLVISLFAGFVLSVVAEVPLLTIEKHFILKDRKALEKPKINNEREEEEDSKKIIDSRENVKNVL